MGGDDRFAHRCAHRHDARATASSSGCKHRRCMDDRSGHHLGRLFSLRQSGDDIVLSACGDVWSGVFGVIGLLPFLSSFSVHDVNVSFSLALLYTSVGATVLAMFLWNVGVKRVGATTAGMFLNFNPLLLPCLHTYFLEKR